ncbi:extensin [Bradyrhizobium sp. 83012]|uniref:Extensin n=1 Tax=Bradyrhizobium aeschynomenes TaxID=2734909 RepID=A0ABX2CDQ1_9BRAD|nr:extensin family protein [Bradyrhizobium aeschynomenes]NPU65585.1 extensin [Bradyrhizobium aeschynomenes]
MVSATATAVALSCLMAGAPAVARSRAADPSHDRVPAAAAAQRQHPVAAVPLPRPRPESAPQPASREQTKDAARDEGTEGGKEGAKEVKAPAPPQSSACRIALTEEIAIAPSIPPIKGPGACGGDDLVRLEAVVLPDKRRVAVTPAAVMRCTMASTVANWVRNDVAPLVVRLGSPIAALDNFDSYQCRGRNNVAGAQMSEHGRANALDVRGFKLADGRMIELTDRTQPRDLREAVLHSVCTHFSTVLGPDSDWYHEDHIHLDLAERRSNYRICQWDVLDPLPKIAPLMPAVRPDDAPPRETADAEEEAKAGTKEGAKEGTKQEAKGEKAAGRAGPRGAAEPDARKAAPSEPSSGDAAAAEAEDPEPATPPPPPQPAPAKGGKKKHKSKS